MLTQRQGTQVAYQHFSLIILIDKWGGNRLVWLWQAMVGRYSDNLEYSWIENASDPPLFQKLSKNPFN